MTTTPLAPGPASRPAARGLALGLGAQALPRALHAGAWWLWALGLATAASRTTNVLLLGLVIAVTAYVVAARRSAAPWARTYRSFLVLGVVVVLVRLAFEVLFGAGLGVHVLVELPQLPVPEWAEGVSVGGPVTVEGLVFGFEQGLQIAAILACVGAASSLANPSRLLGSVPGALYEVGVALVVALTFAPQAVTDLQRMRAARRLRGRADRGLRGLVAVGLPVLEDALERSVSLAASMDARGYGRRAHVPRALRATTSACTLGGLVALVVGCYGLLDAGSPGWLGLPLMLAGTATAAAGLWLGGRRAVRTHYRPDPWLAAEWLTALSGLAAAAALIWAQAQAWAGMTGSGGLLAWPTLPLVPAAGILVALLPAWVTPPPEVDA